MKKDLEVGENVAQCLKGRNASKDKGKKDL
jgi:hypothetical protein